MAQGKGLISIAAEAPLLQLKAYYIGHIAENTRRVLDSFGVDTLFDLQVPEWLVPLCALVAALITIVGIARWIVFRVIRAFRLLSQWWNATTRSGE
jgi:hypothetical protein